MPDSIVTATGADAPIAFAAAVTTHLVAEIRERHDLWPTASAAVGRLTTATALFAAQLKSNERISLRIGGNGPLKTIAADAWFLEEGVIGARGYAHNPQVELPIDERGKFAVASAIGDGALQVTRSSEIGQPYVGVVPLVSGEIAEDVAEYLAQSEQIPSIVALGVLANPSGIAAAGGVMAQVLPGADEAVLASLEARASKMPAVTRLIAEGADANALLHALSGSTPLRARRELEVRFACMCSRAKVERVLLGMGADELLALSRERDRTEATCEFCKTRYLFDAAEIATLVERK
jgi:molecular chaperone Hsp33